MRFSGGFSGCALQGEIPGKNLAALAEFAKFLAVHLDPDRARVTGPYADLALRFEGLREAWLRDLLVRQGPIGEDT